MNIGLCVSRVSSFTGNIAVARASIVSVVITLALVTLAFWLNPTPEQHREQIRQAIAERSPVAGLLGLGAFTAFVSHYHPLGVASYTMVNQRLVSIGAFGVVVVLEPMRVQ